jgi:hypothetical protein
MIARRVLPVVPLFLTGIPCIFGQLPKKFGEMPALSHIGSRNPGDATSTGAG